MLPPTRNVFLKLSTLKLICESYVRCPHHVSGSPCSVSQTAQTYRHGDHQSDTQLSHSAHISLYHTVRVGSNLKVTVCVVCELCLNVDLCLQTLY